MKRVGTPTTRTRRPSHALVPLLLGLLFLAFPPPSLTAQAPADSIDRALLGVLAAALSTSSEVWPGYALASRPLVAYRPDKWVVLVDPPEPDPEGWAPYPDAWPPLPVPAVVRTGETGDLIGQLDFDYEVAGGRTVAVPLYEEIPAELGDRDRYLYAFLTHESFHRYQREAFSDVETPSEEAYPILDARNNALAGLEMRVLERALTALERGDEAAARRLAGEALVVHAERWRGLDEPARAIERAKEVVEGTAKYVETRAVDDLARRCREGLADAAGVLCARFHDLTATRWIAEELALHLEGGAVSPRDMPRNRIYPVGAALGLLLDAFAPGWKRGVEEAGTSRSLHDWLEAALEPDEGGREAVLRTAMEREGWEELLAASRDRVEAHRASFEAALSEFDARPGLKVIVELPDRDLARSRSSRDERWVVDRGRRVLGAFVTYALTRGTEPGFRLALRDREVLDETLEGERRRVTFHLEDLPRLSLDGAAVTPVSPGRWTFGRLQLAGEGVEIETAIPGTVEREDETLRIRLSPEPAPPAHAFVGVDVVPMTVEGGVLPAQTVVVRDGRIVAIGPRAEIEVPEDAIRIEGEGGTLVPGLADMHVHLERFDDPVVLDLLLAHGVTTVRNMDGRPHVRRAGRPHDRDRRADPRGHPALLGRYPGGRVGLRGARSRRRAGGSRLRLREGLPHALRWGVLGRGRRGDRARAPRRRPCPERGRAGGRPRRRPGVDRAPAGVRRGDRGRRLVLPARVALVEALPGDAGRYGEDRAGGRADGGGQGLERAHARPAGEDRPPGDDARLAECPRGGLGAGGDPPPVGPRGLGPWLPRAAGGAGARGDGDPRARAAAAGGARPGPPRGRRRPPRRD